MRPFADNLLLRPIRAIATAFALTILLSGCQSLGTDGLVASNAPAEISGPAASAIAGDMVSRLAEQIGPGKATVALKADAHPSGRRSKQHSRDGVTPSSPTRRRTTE